MVNQKNINLILINGNILTMDINRPEARWVHIHDNMIYATGEGDEWRNLCSGRDDIIDCKGKTVLPGFIDSHMHLYSYAEKLITIDLSADRGVRSIIDIQDILRSHLDGIPRQGWVRGKGYNEFCLHEKRHPNRWDLDKSAPYHAVKITHRTGHAHVLNSLALRLAGISRETPDPPGGIIDRDLNTGEPTGLLYEMSDYLSHHIPSIDPEEIKKGIVLANRELTSKGITSIQDASVNNDRGRWDLFNGWKGSSLLRPRVNFIIGSRAYNEYGTNNFCSVLPENQIRIAGVKIILDETTGSLLPPEDELEKAVSDIHRSGRQAVIHAIEEKAIKAACKSIEQALKLIPRKDHRHRIEHCSICPPYLAGHISLNQIMIVTHPEFIYHGGDRYIETVPEKDLRHLYAINTMIKNGVTVAAGSDCPVVSPDPVLGINTAISRLSKKGSVINIDEKISLHDALSLYTINAAKTSFEENIKGSITPGKLADLIILESDIMRTSVDELKEIQVVMTIIDGEVVLDRID